MRHPRLPLGRAWVPLLSIGLYLLAWLASLVLPLVPERRLGAGPLPMSKQAMARALRRLAWVVLCSGSYTLVDMRVPEERVQVKVRLI